eukprot:TRINITY_DN55012_c0_g1_i1.p1 TRINITY_DN55012_c0_g1~~TRINITY_DN55012_c0_g1_i1.p1  ORF type:complete len:650 (-),score=82.24 TRINITY_DN55012_c0_g1_i1:10-1959(-)
MLKLASSRGGGRIYFKINAEVGHFRLGVVSGVQCIVPSCRHDTPTTLALPSCRQAIVGSRSFVFVSPCQRGLVPGIEVSPHSHEFLRGRGGFSLAASATQVRSFAQKRSRSGRLQHYRFGTERVKGRYYYRFHKIIGKWNWRKYTERFIAPRALENRQRFIPTAFGNYRHTKHSYSWLWRLPKELAEATTPDEVLETWIKFRHKLPKKTYHYFKVLKRLVDVGGCEATDWRLKFITSRLHNIHRKILNLPRLAHYYAQLKVHSELGHVCRFLYPMLHKYEPRQLALIPHAYAIAGLQDKRLLSDVAGLLESKLEKLSPAEIVRLASAFATAEVCHYTFLSALSAQVQVRVVTPSTGQAPFGSCPSLDQLSDIATAFARLKFQDYSFFEMCSALVEHSLREGLPGPTPPTLARLCTAGARLKIHEVRLYEAVLSHISEHWYDYPAGTLAEIGAAVAPVLPHESEDMRHVYLQMLEVVSANRNTLTLVTVGLAARFMAEVDHQGEFLPGFSQALVGRIKDLRDTSRDRYDVARVTEILLRRFPQDDLLASCLCKHLHRHLAIFEPLDFVRFARGLSASEYRDDRVTHAMAKWARKRSAEFSTVDWDALVDALGKLGARESSFAAMRAPLPQLTLPPVPNRPTTVANAAVVV